VTKEGRLVEDGSHDTLMKNGTLYSRLWREWHDA
jgi:ABC-type multidrug transport system fused ATPase/permease subunit